MSSQFAKCKLSTRTNANNVELETTFQQLLLDLRSNAVETDVALREDGIRGSHCVDLVGGGKP